MTMNSVEDLRANLNGIVATAGLYLGLCGVAVGLRFVTKCGCKAGLGADDWWILVSLVLFYVMEALELQAVLWGRHASGFTDHKYQVYFKGMYYYGIFYFMTITSVNVSILLLYRRIFSTPSFRRISMVIIAVCILWCIPGTLVEIFVCNPINSLWDRTVSGSCIHYGVFFVVIMTIELAIDIVILVLPVQEIVNLHLSWKQKWLLSVIFLLGGFVVVTGVVRIAVSYRAGDPNISLTDDAIWLNVHVGTAIICACLPTYRPLLSRTASILGVLWSRYGFRYPLYGSTDVHVGINADRSKNSHDRYMEFGNENRDSVDLIEAGRFFQSRRSSDK